MDALYDATLNEKITPYIIQTRRTPSLTQVVNTSLSGKPYIQNIGSITYTTEVEFVLQTVKDSNLYQAWESGNLMKVVDDDKTLYGYIIELQLEDDLVDGYHKGTLTLQEEQME